MCTNNIQRKIRAKRKENWRASDDDDDDENDKLCYKFVSFVQIILHLDFQCEYECIIFLAY